MSRRCRQVSVAATLVIAFVFFATLAPVRALAVDTEPSLSEAQCAIVVDSAGNVLWSKNADQEMPMLGLTNSVRGELIGRRVGESFKDMGA